VGRPGVGPAAGLPAAAATAAAAGGRAGIAGRGPAGHGQPGAPQGGCGVAQEPLAGRLVGGGELYAAEGPGRLAEVALVEGDLAGVDAHAADPDLSPAPPARRDDGQPPPGHGSGEGEHVAGSEPLQGLVDLVLGPGAADAGPLAPPG